MRRHVSRELRFLFSPLDEDRFESFVEDSGWTLAEVEPMHWFIEDGEGRIQYLKCCRTADAIAMGRIAFRTTPTDRPRHFGALERWVRTHATNRVYVVNVRIPGSERRSKSVWVGTEAARLAAGGEMSLKQSLTDNIVYHLLEGDSDLSR